MPDDTSKAEAKLQKLGERLRQAWAKQHPLSDKSLDTVRGAVREQYEKDQAVQRHPAPEPKRDKSRDPDPPEPEG